MIAQGYESAQRVGTTDAPMRAAEEALTELSKLADRADMLVQQASHKLGPYRSEAAVNPAPGTPVRSLPPYFEELRSIAFRIDAALGETMRVIDETEL